MTTEFCNMKKITVWLMKRNLKNAIKKHENETNSIVKSAYANLIKNYKDTIMYLEAEITSDKARS